MTVEPGTPERMRTDEQRLAQILRNLLSNAFKFTEKGEVGLRVFASDGNTISMAVSDSGIGVAPHEQAVIFEAFRQADGSTHRRFGGTGLGLSISRNLAQLLGGDIVVHSTPGQGSVFTLTLPIEFVGERPTSQLRATPPVVQVPALAIAPMPARTNEAPGLRPCRTTIAMRCRRTPARSSSSKTTSASPRSSRTSRMRWASSASSRTAPATA